MGWLSFSSARASVLLGLLGPSPGLRGSCGPRAQGTGHLGGRSPFPSPVPEWSLPPFPHADGLMDSGTLEGKLVLTSTLPNAPLSERLGTP